MDGYTWELFPQNSSWIIFIFYKSYCGETCPTCSKRKTSNPTEEIEMGSHSSSSLIRDGVGPTCPWYFPRYGLLDCPCKLCITNWQIRMFGFSSIGAFDWFTSSKVICPVNPASMN